LSGAGRITKADLRVDTENLLKASKKEVLATQAVVDLMMQEDRAAIAGADFHSISSISPGSLATEEDGSGYDRPQRAYVEDADDAKTPEEVEAQSQSSRSDQIGPGSFDSTPPSTPVAEKAAVETPPTAPLVTESPVISPGPPLPPRPKQPLLDVLQVPIPVASVEKTTTPPPLPPRPVKSKVVPDVLPTPAPAVVEIEPALVHDINVPPSTTKLSRKIIYKHMNVGSREKDLTSGLVQRIMRFSNEMPHEWKKFLSKHTPFARSRRHHYTNLVTDFCLSEVIVSQKKDLDKLMWFWQSDDEGTADIRLEELHYFGNMFTHVSEVLVYTDLVEDILSNEVWTKRGPALLDKGVLRATATLKVADLVAAHKHHKEYSRDHTLLMNTVNFLCNQIYLRGLQWIAFHPNDYKDPVAVSFHEGGRLIPSSPHVPYSAPTPYKPKSTHSTATTVGSHSVKAPIH
jgi:hypothetical protein